MDLSSACIKPSIQSSYIGQFIRIKEHGKYNQMDNLDGELQINYSLLKVQRIFIQPGKWFTETEGLIGKEISSYSELNNLEPTGHDKGRQVLGWACLTKTPLLYFTFQSNNIFQILIAELWWKKFIYYSSDWVVNLWKQVKFWTALQIKELKDVLSDGRTRGKKRLSYSLRGHKAEKLHLYFQEKVWTTERKKGMSSVSF